MMVAVWFPTFRYRTNFWTCKQNNSALLGVPYTLSSFHIDTQYENGTQKRIWDLACQIRIRFLWLVGSGSVFPERRIRGFFCRGSDRIRTRSIYILFTSISTRIQTSTYKNDWLFLFYYIKCTAITKWFITLLSAGQFCSIKSLEVNIAEVFHK